MLDFIYDMLDYVWEVLITFKKWVIAFVIVGIVAVCGVWLMSSGNRPIGRTEVSYAGDAFLPRICVSLKVLNERVSCALAESEAVSDECAKLCGLSYVEGYVIDNSEGAGDVILVGLRCEGRPSLRLDDLVVGMRSISASGYPYCSLDPVPGNIVKCQRMQQEISTSKRGVDEEALTELRTTLGPQRVVVGGVPRNSRMAHVMIEADYHMKKVSQGHIMLPGIESYLDISLGDEHASSSSSSRFWFHIAEGDPAYSEDIGIMWLERCRVIVLTEKQEINTAGELVDVEEDDPAASAFAEQFARELPVVAQFVPCYADLENLYRLRAVLLAIELRNALSIMNLDFNSYLAKYECSEEKEMVPSYPGLVNVRQVESSRPSGITVRTAYVFGGVSQEMLISPERIAHDNEAVLNEIVTVVEESRPGAESLWWYVN